MQMTVEQEVTLTQLSEIIPIPAGYQLSHVYSGTQDKIPVFVYRYTLDGNLNIGSEHFSITLSQTSGRLIGFTWMDRQFEKTNSHLSKEETKNISRQLMDDIEGGLFDSLDNLWIDVHDEEILVNSQETIISGMKYKCYLPSEKTYAWVIVGTNGQVITFERDILWDSDMSHRISEKWLHDDWLHENS